MGTLKVGMTVIFLSLLASQSALAGKSLSDIAVLFQEVTTSAQRLDSDADPKALELQNSILDHVRENAPLSVESNAEFTDAVMRHLPRLQEKLSQLGDNPGNLFVSIVEATASITCLYSQDRLDHWYAEIAKPLIRLTLPKEELPFLAKIRELTIEGYFIGYSAAIKAGIVLARQGQAALGRVPAEEWGKFSLGLFGQSLRNGPENQKSIELQLVGQSVRVFVMGDRNVEIKTGFKYPVDQITAGLISTDLSAHLFNLLVERRK